MIDRHHPDPAERDELTEQDLAIATLVGRYIERREAGQPPCAHDLLAVAAEFGNTAVDVLRTVLACYEAMRASRRPHNLTETSNHPRPRRSPMPRTDPFRRRYARGRCDERPGHQPDRHRGPALRGPPARLARHAPRDRALERRHARARR